MFCSESDYVDYSVIIVLDWIWLKSIILIKNSMLG